MDLCQEAARRHEEGGGIHRRQDRRADAANRFRLPARPRTASRTGAAPQPSLKEAGKNAQIPDVYVAFGPTELIETRGEPVFKPSQAPGLEYAENTNGDFFRFNGEYYVLISGRWFKGPSLARSMDLRQRS